MGCIASTGSTMRAATLFALAAIASLAPVANVPGSAGADVELRAKHALRTALDRKYEGIDEWTISEISDESVWSEIPHGLSVRYDVVQAGPRSALRLTWREANKITRTRTVWFAVQGMQSVPVAARDIRAGEDVLSVDVRNDVRDALALGCTPTRGIDGVMRARHSIEMGEAVCQRSVERRPAVARGETVTVHYMSGRVSVTTKGVALQDGAIGQKLRVKNPESHESFSAIVSSPREVVIRD